MHLCDTQALDTFNFENRTQFMPASLNKVMLIGHVGKDPDIR
jgi:hypothetical protein